MGQIAVRKTRNRKIDGRTLDAKRLKALISGITDIELQSVVLKRLAASLVLTQEKLEAKQVKGEDVDPDAWVRIAGALTRTLTQLNECVSPKRHWESPQEIAEREERRAYLDTLSEIELLALREQVAPGAPPPAYSAPSSPVEPVLTDTQRGVYRESDEARADALTQQKKKEKNIRAHT